MTYSANRRRMTAVYANGAVLVGLENVRNPSKLGDWVFTLKPGDQFPQQRVERFLLGLGQRQQEPLLVGDMAADRLVDQALARVSEHNQFAATVLGVGAAHHEPGAWQTPAPDSRQGYFK